MPTTGMTASSPGLNSTGTTGKSVLPSSVHITHAYAIQLDSAVSYANSTTATSHYGWANPTAPLHLKLAMGLTEPTVP